MKVLLLLLLLYIISNTFIHTFCKNSKTHRISQFRVSFVAKVYIHPSEYVQSPNIIRSSMMRQMDRFFFFLIIHTRRRKSVSVGKKKIWKWCTVSLPTFENSWKEKEEEGILYYGPAGIACVVDVIKASPDIISIILLLLLFLLIARKFFLTDDR